jgi:aspartate/methionine/tyrosine aminotransferase
MNFSERTYWNLAENDLTAALRERRQADKEIFDLTLSNPTQCGFMYDEAALLAPLSNREALQYEPDPLGIPAARDAVAQYYRDACAEVSLDRICLTTSTSEAYSFLFRLLCNSGDEVLVARPSYPLFEFIARLDDVRLREYSLLYDPNADLSTGHGWSIDFHSLEEAIMPKTRAIIVVHPNNPTGNFASAAERGRLEALCAARGLVLVVDEVFLDYALGETQPSFTCGETRCLTFVLSGISKVCGLPQMKASWIAACGPAELVRQAMERLEVIADTFLSMNAPVQHALRRWLAARHPLQRQIVERMRGNVARIDRRLRGSSAQRLAMEAGWTAILRVPRAVDGMEFAAAALDAGVFVQPGEFYELGEGRIVLSLLTPPELMDRGLERLPID